MIIPAILEQRFEEIEKKIEICKSFSNTIHIDFIDGKFAKNNTFFEIEKFKKYSSEINLEAHLMVDEPINFLDMLSHAGFKRFVGHVEKMSDQVAFVAKGEAIGAVGLGLDLSTPVSEIKIPFDDLDQILLMSVKAGKSGQEFDNSIIEKIKTLRSKYLGRIEIDGGINDKTLPLAKKAGATDFCVTSFLFRDDPKRQYDMLKTLL